MKITKSQLKQIIKEEIRRALNESAFEDLETNILLATSSIDKGSMPMMPEEMQSMTVSFIDSALLAVQSKLTGLVSSEDFSKAVIRAAKEWVEE